MDDATPEEWRAIPGFSGYEASNLGRIWSVLRPAQGVEPPRMIGGRVLRGTLLSDGHVAHMLTTEDGVKRRYAHQLVAWAFLGPRPEGTEVRHLNDVGTDNRLENLCYGTRQENIQDMLRNGNNYFANRTHCPKGHPYDEANTIRSGRGGRCCRTCDNERTLRRYHEKQVNPDAPRCRTPGCLGATWAKGLCGTCYARAAKAAQRGPDWNSRVCPECQGAFMIEPAGRPRKYCSPECAAEVRRRDCRERARRQAAAKRAA